MALVQFIGILGADLNHMSHQESKATAVRWVNQGGAALEVG